jgi:hypothetical protein
MLLRKYKYLTGYRCASMHTGRRNTKTNELLKEKETGEIFSSLIVAGCIQKE